MFKISAINYKYQKEINPVQINFRTIKNAVRGEITFIPFDDAQQAIINSLVPGYYMISILPGNFYLVSISNTNQADTYTKVSINLFSPSSLKVEAGMPFTFNCEINGRMSSD